MPPTSDQTLLMKTIIKLTGFAFAMFIWTNLSAQKKAVTGFYITLQGDTVRGIFPSYAQWNRNPAEVEFTSTTSLKSILLTPLMCRKFVVEGYDEYLSYSGQRLTNPIDDDEIMGNYTNSSNSDEYGNIVTFLRLVSRTNGGELYFYKDGKRSNFYFRLNDKPLAELRYKKYYDKGQIREIAEYKQQLNNLFAETIEQRKLSSSLERLPYTEDELSVFLEALFPQEKAPVRRGKNPANGWIVSAGVIRNTIQVTEDKTFLSVSRKQEASLSPLLSVGYYHLFNRNFGRFFIFPQVTFFRFKNIDESSDGGFLSS